MKRWIAGILCVSCLLMMTACSRNGEEVSGSREESSQAMESSSESVEQPSEDFRPEETAEPEEPVSSQPRTVSIRPVTSAEAEPVQVNVTAGMPLRPKWLSSPTAEGGGICGRAAERGSQ